MMPAIEDQLRAIRQDATYSDRLQAWRQIETPKKALWARVVRQWFVYRQDLPRSPLGWLVAGSAEKEHER